MRKNRGGSIQLAKRRQWGAERNTEPLPIVHKRPSTRKMTLSRLAIVLTVCLWAVYVIYTIVREFFDGPKGFEFTMQAISYVVVVSFLVFSALMYLISRQGALLRFSKHARVPRAELDNHFSKSQPSITVLVPSYSEEPSVIRKTLLSAALQEYPKKRVVLLLDDKPNPKDTEDAARLMETRELGQKITELLSEPRQRFGEALKAFEAKTKNAKPTDAAKQTIVKELAEHYAWAAAGLYKMADKETIEDHVDVFFADQVLRSLAGELDLTADALLASRQEGAELPLGRVHQLYRRLAWIFNAEMDSFERKKYASLTRG